MMRVSVNRNDRGWIHGQYRRYEVYLDGAKMERCITADEERGFVLVQAVDQEGRARLNAARTGVLTRTLRGRVEVRDLQQTALRMKPKAMVVAVWSALRELEHQARLRQAAQP